ncbi:hypothetical protein BS17DRAFT_879710 [Gyrodon lividus]|nr:hypothetical protein BS17DRAFT_879710 [Gyrodon lividus]
MSNSGTAALQDPATYTALESYRPPLQGIRDPPKSFATSQAIPNIDQERKTGGIVLIGWSLGASSLHSLLAYLDALPAEQLKDLESYFRLTQIGWVYRYQPHSTWSDVAGSRWSQDPVERFEQFRGWVTGYYTHANIQSRNSNDLEFKTPTLTMDDPHGDLLEGKYNEMTSIDMFAGPDLFRILIDRSGTPEITHATGALGRHSGSEAPQGEAGGSRERGPLAALRRRCNET